jgi:chaperonin GroEL (HSP60 family)
MEVFKGGFELSAVGTDREGKDIMANTESFQYCALKAINEIESSISITMGAAGREVGFCNNQRTISTKDGVNILKKWTEHKDPLIRAMALYLWGGVNKQERSVGDGTTATIVLASAMLHCLLSSKATNKYNQIANFKKAVQSHINGVREASIKEDAVTLELLRSVAKTSSNGNLSISNKIAELIYRMGKDAIIKVEYDDSIETCEVEQQMRYMFEDNNRGSGSFSAMLMLDVNDANKIVTEVRTPCKVVMINDDITEWKQIQTVFERWSKEVYDTDIEGSKEPLVFMANGFRGNVISSLIKNRKGGWIGKDGKDVHAYPIYCVLIGGVGNDKTDGTNSLRVDFMNDMEAMSGAEQFGIGYNRNVDTFTVSDLGRLDMISITTTRTWAVGHNSRAKQINERVEQLQYQLQNDLVAKANGYFRDRLKARLAYLTTGTGIIKYYHSSDSASNALYDSIEDTYMACISAMKSGVCIGGGAALTNQWRKLSNKDETYLLSPLYAILTNADVDEKVISSFVGGYNKNNNNFYNVLTSKIEDAIESGVIDSCDVICKSLENACELACGIYNMEYIIFSNEQTQ